MLQQWETAGWGKGGRFRSTHGQDSGKQGAVPGPQKNDSCSGRTHWHPAFTAPHNLIKEQNLIWISPQSLAASSSPGHFLPVPFPRSSSCPREIRRKNTCSHINVSGHQVRGPPKGVIGSVPDTEQSFLFLSDKILLQAECGGKCL